MQRVATIKESVHVPVESVMNSMGFAVSPPVNLPAPVRYFRPEEGGVSHFNYVRDNLLLSWMHARLFGEFLLRLPRLFSRRERNRRTA